MIYIKMKSLMICIVIILCVIIIFLFSKEVLKEKTVQCFSEEKEVSKGIFESYQKKANEKIKSMTLEEKVEQLFLVRFPDEKNLEDTNKYKFGGYVFFEKDFKEKTEEVVKNEIKNLQNGAEIPLLIAVDEEGGKVVRVSSNTKLAKEKFKSPMELYEIGGFNKIEEDTIEKSNLLYNLGINLNLAPVVDVSTNENDYIYQRTLGKGTKLTSIYAETVIKASKETKVSYTLKHFPGYGSNKDTHKESSTYNKTYEDIIEIDIPPFKYGIEAGAEAIMVSHNIVTSVDKNSPASLSKKIHEILRNELEFTGIIITDDLDMEAVKNEDEVALKAILAGNDLIITTDYKKDIETLKKALKEGKISEEIINDRVCRIISWKYYKNMF